PPSAVQVIDALVGLPNASSGDAVNASVLSRQQTAPSGFTVIFATGPGPTVTRQVSPSVMPLAFPCAATCGATGVPALSKSVTRSLPAGSRSLGTVARNCTSMRDELCTAVPSFTSAVPEALASE